MRRMWSALIITAALAAPGALPVSAAAAPAVGPAGEPAAVVVRIYDPYRHDYHRWDHSEQARYRAYLRERHERYVAYERQREAQRRAYWRWRHEHDR
jgi:hypothetical protein